MFDSIIKKSKEAFTKAKDGIEEKRRIYNLQKEEWDKLVLANHSIHLTNQLVVKNENPSDGRIKKIQDLSPSVNNDKGKLLAELIALEEVILDVCYVKEATTNKEYFFCITDQGIYITDLTNYDKYEFNKIKVIKNVMPGILSSNININNVPFIVEGSKEEATRLISILSDTNFRNIEISKEKEHLKGIKPLEEYINKYYRGVTIGEDAKFVLHDENNDILLNINDIVSLDILCDSSVVYTKSVEQNTAFTASGFSCYKQSLRVVLTNGKYIIDILPPNTMSSVYNSTDKEYIDAYNLCKQIINRLYNLRMGGK